MCRQQLVDFTNAADKFREAGIALVAGSADDLEHARAFVEELKIPFPVAYGFNAKEISHKTGAFYDAEGGYLHATGFVINPVGVVVNGVYSTMAIGRLVAKDTLGLVHYLKAG
jgi:peroxiredoxin